ncbi:MAG: hypothetical protein DRP78_00465 [Candidatus Omnitrophota bacterium]|nr:MAG: hypothetical protein DRP78_00465 [Candidatus Omnitrophota bacterium]
MNESKNKLLEPKQDLQFVKCALCGRDDYEVLSGYCRYDVKARNVVCKHCGLVYINPRKSKGQISQYYQQQYRRQYKIIDLESKDYRRANIALSGSISRLLLKPNCAVMEIGCANGILLEEMKKAKPDAEFYGIEPDLKLSSQARDRGINVFCGILEDYPETEKKFDLIILMHVLEHCVDPVIAFSKVRRMLKDDGFVFFEVPDILHPYGDLEKNFFQEAHLFTFSANTLHILCKLTGLVWLVEHIGSTLVYILRKGKIFKPQDIDFNKEGENYVRLRTFLRKYKAKFNCKW